MNRWSERYFALNKDRLQYFTSEVNIHPLKLFNEVLIHTHFAHQFLYGQDKIREQPRGQFEIVKGIAVGDITEMDAPTKTMKRKV